jgi:hypothetical protein
MAASQDKEELEESDDVPETPEPLRGVEGELEVVPGGAKRKPFKVVQRRVGNVVRHVALQVGRNKPRRGRTSASVLAAKRRALWANFMRSMSAREIQAKLSVLPKELRKSTLVLP